MPLPELADIRATIDRANKNIDDLKVFLPRRELTKETGDLAAIEMQADGKTYDIFIGAAPPSTDLRMAIGDVIHGLRTALDHLAYRLALKNGFPAIGSRTPDDLKRLRKLSFLIHDDAQRFRSAAGNIEPLIGKPAVAEMEKLQVYVGTDPRAPILRRLSELDNITKHRTLAVLAQVLNRADIDVTIGNQIIKGTVTGMAGATLTDRTKLASFVIEGLNFQPQLGVNIASVLTMAFAETDGLCDGANVFHVMRDSVATVNSVVDDFEKLFL